MRGYAVRLKKMHDRIVKGQNDWRTVMNAQDMHPFQSWIEENGVRDIRFFPANVSVSTPTELLDEAMEAVRAYENGKTVPYNDNLDEHFLPHDS